MNKRHPRFYIAICLIIATAACSKMDSTYDEYVDKEILYLPKADSIKIRSGKNRLQLSWLLKADPTVNKTKVYWNNRLDSALVTVNRKNPVDTLQLLLNPLTEGTYTFQLVTLDDAGNASIRVDVTGNVYGDNYNGSLLNRAIKTVTLKKDTATIDWYGGNTDMRAVQLRYKDTLNTQYELTIPAVTAKTALVGTKKGVTVFEYRTMYTPQVNALDTFYTNYTNRTIN